MFATLKALYDPGKDFARRTFDLTVLKAVLDGTIYDKLGYEFHQEMNGANEYVPIDKRKPSVRYNLCRLVVEDSVSLLFGEGRFPQIDCEDKATRDTMGDLMKSLRMNSVMIDAAIRGSVGSVAIQMRVLKERVFLDVFDTAYLTPEYDPESPDTLVMVTEKRKVRGRDLAEVGYDIKDEYLAQDHWFMRCWDDAADTWFIPWPVQEQDAEPVVDANRSVSHSLGFVPIVWIKNLPGGNGIDGGCTFTQAIDIAIQIDYQLSQAGRGLKYSSEPTLLLKEPAQNDGVLSRSSSSAIIVSEKGDAKLLEINGTASQAVIEYVRALRELALESVHGNRSNADKVSAAQSGRALELMHQPLIWLADNLRISYGEDALLRLCTMIVEAAKKTKVTLRGKPVTFSDQPMSLRWPVWFAPTELDKNTDANTLATHRNAGHLSQETSVKAISASFDIEDVPAEIARIKADEAAADARALEQATAQTKITETSPG